MSEENDKITAAIETEQQQNEKLDTSTIFVVNKEKQPTDTSAELEDTWANLSEDWQAQPFEKTDIQALLKQTKRRTLWAKSLFVLNLVATVGIIIAFFVGLYQGDWRTATIVYLGLGSLISAVFVYYEIKIRQQIWLHSSDSPDKAIVNAIAGCKSSIKYVQLIKLSAWLMLPLINGYIYEMSLESEKSYWPPFIVINLFMLVTWFITHIFHLKRNKELKQLLSL